CMPDRAYFGLKDAQQYLIIDKMVRDLNMNVEIIPMQTVREADGLAMSSRNVYLTDEERKAAPLIQKGLTKALKMYENGETDAKKVKAAISDTIAESQLFKLDYLEAVSKETLCPVEGILPGTLIAVAAYLGKARLIDNIIL
ncbi:MAG TPA: pantoate--beta-alanine ligase, partial [bacterium]|nr:pantoate--beta-alanine ligase [bacterium]